MKRIYPTHKRNLNHSELYLQLYIYLTPLLPPAPTSTNHVLAWFAGPALQSGRKATWSGGSSPHHKECDLSFWQNLHISPIEQPSGASLYSTWGPEFYCVCVATCIYISCTWRTHTHTHGVISTGDREDMSPPLFEIPFVSPHFKNMFIYFF